MIEMPKGMSLQERAAWEVAYVRDCTIDFEKRSASVDDEIARLQREKAELEALIGAKLAGRDLNTLPELERIQIESDLERLETLEDAIADQTYLKEQFAKTINLLTTFHQTLTTFYQKGQYKFLVKSIPEKKLARYVADVDKISSVIELVEKIQKKFLNETARVNAKLDRSRTRRQRSREVAAESRTLGATATADSRRAETLKRFSAPATAPVDVTAPNTNENTTPNTNTNPS